MTDEINAKPAKEYICVNCNFKCSNKYNYTNHLSTAKHIRLTIHDKKLQFIYKCICGNEYKHRQSLYNHKKTCSEIADVNYKNKIIEELLKQNNELKELIIEQKELIIEQKEEKQELKEVIIEQCEQSKKVLELALEQKELTIKQTETQNDLMKQIKEKGIGTNNHFNMNFFLNDTCKDAMNIDDLYKVIKEYKVPHNLILAFENTKHVAGVSNVFDVIIDSVPVNKRPIHCSDVKREVMHIKQNNTWENEKEPIENIMKVLLRYIRGKCFDEVYYYQQHFMDITKDKDEDIYNNMLMHVCNDAVNIIEAERIISRIAKRTTVVREKPCNPLIKDME
jgi:hypothetical protein